MSQAVPPIDLVAGAGRPMWVWAWSPLMPLGDLPRRLPADELVLPELLILPAPKVGMFWTAGNPGGLRFEVADRRAEFEVGYLKSAGTYRRPLDAGSRSSRYVWGWGWGPLGDGGAGIGRVAVERGSLADGAFANVLTPYASEPYAVLDTVGEQTGRTTVLIEGAGGWTIGRLGVGLALSYGQQETRTVASAVPRLATTAMPGLNAGMVYAPQWAPIRMGAYGRWQQTADRAAILSVAAATRLYELTGYSEPVPINLSSNLYSRRFERQAWAIGSAFEGALGGFAGLVYGQLERRNSANFSTTAGPEALRDTWEAQGWSLGGAVQAALRGGRVLAVAEARYTSLSGEAVHADIEGIPFSANECAAWVSGDVRVQPVEGWQAAAMLGLSRTDRHRRDDLAQVYSDLQAWRPSMAVEVARRLFSDLAIAVGAATAEHNPAGAVPISSDMGAIYRNWIGPELGLEATEAHARAGTMTLLWSPRPGVAVTARAGYVRTAPPAFSTVNLADRPRGNRGEWRAMLGVVLAQPEP